MGVFSFIKDAGEKIFGRDKKEAEKPTEKTENTREKAERENAKAASKLETTLRDLKLQVENLSIKIDDDVATVTGKAEDQSTKEKVVLVVGNSEGIAKVDDRMTVDKTKPEAKFHTVERGDTLSKIAKEHYGDAMKYPVIFEANKPMLKDPDKIYPGQVLRVPHLEKK
ncbi:MAG: peptidoglycan-binding protein LysM [Bacteroidota bacterium]